MKAPARLAAAALAAVVATAAAPEARAQEGAPAYTAGPYDYETTADEMSPALGRAYVLAIQNELIARGYSPGVVDGAEGPRTRSAILAYQRDAGLRQTGRASRELLDHLKFAAPRRDAGGATVREIQRRLASLGYYAGAVDGVVGPMTRAAIRGFQKSEGLATTGAADRALLSALDRARR